MSVNHPKEPFVGGGGGWHSRGHSLSTAVTTHGQEAVGEALGLDQKAATQGSGSSSRRGDDGRGQDQEKAIGTAGRCARGSPFSALWPRAWG